MSDRGSIVDVIKRYQPVSLKVTLRDGTEKPVAVPKAGNRWARTQQVLDALPWQTIECLDKDGRTSGVVEEDEEDGFDDADDGDGANVALARVLLEVMRGTMKETRQMFDAQLRGQAELLNAMTEGMRHMSESYRQALAVQASHLLAPEGGTPEVAQMMQMALTLLNQPKAAAQVKP